MAVELCFQEPESASIDCFWRRPAGAIRSTVRVGAWHVTCDVQTSNDMMDIPPATVTVRINGADFM